CQQYTNLPPVTF
nr:immunoglobulin light chain junction region [Macaca mulatta]MOV92845.1 immunoglobulin light chain junction region [Macaca mulatta]MOV92897.1 immunoglobulin light chain junction region [Macaca mulatta]MOV93134.1 immunoglobulin light chain junction region [Macaca mulatta]MOV93190.1 immunoglobulin light chain junction region [Macaca mulatta]